MMRVCHLDTCPVGIATQNPELRARFTGKPEFVVDLLRVHRRGGARAPRARSASARIEEAVGHVERLDTGKAIDHWKAAGSTSRRSSHVPTARPAPARRNTTSAGPRPRQGARQRAHRARARTRSSDGEPVRDQVAVRNVNRTVGTMLGHEVTKRYRGDGLPDNTIDLTLTGSAGQSLRRLPARGITLRLLGDANDYVGKGLSGGRDRRPSRPRGAARRPSRTSSPATSSATARPRGEIFLRGNVGERFCVRNSGATAVVEGVGDHGCEYMTGGTRPGPRADGPQLRGRHVRRHRPTSSTSTRDARQPRASSTSTPLGRATTATCCATLLAQHRG